MVISLEYFLGESRDSGHEVLISLSPPGDADVPPHPEVLETPHWVEATSFSVSELDRQALEADPEVVDADYVDEDCKRISFNH